MFENYPIPSKLRIPYIVDTQRPELELIPAHIIENFYEVHELANIRFNEKNRFLCFECREPITLHASAVRHSETSSPYINYSEHKYHPQHKAGYGECCVWKTGAATKGEIYKGVQEGKRHAELKRLLAETLLALSDWELVGTIADMDRYYLIHPDKRRGRPDVHAKYKGREVVFEIQLRSESPETIMRRKNLYKDLGKQLVWLSIENSEIVSSKYEFDSIEVKQVQKDIAFSNRGSWFLFDEKMAKASIECKNLQLKTMYWHPEINGTKVYYDWKQELIDFSKLIYSEGETFYKDFYQQDSALKARLRDSGKMRILEALHVEKPHKYMDFFMMAKEIWPSLDNEVDTPWLTSTFGLYHQERVVVFKKLIIDFFKSTEWRDRGKLDRWIKLSISVADMDFGLFDDMGYFHLQVIEKLLLILGYNLSPYLNSSKKSHRRSTHYFFDNNCSRFFVYRELCLKAINNSYLSENIYDDPKVVERLNREIEDVDQVNDLDVFFSWFIQEPVYKPS